MKTRRAVNSLTGLDPQSVLSHLRHPAVLSHRGRAEVVCQLCSPSALIYCDLAEDTLICPSLATTRSRPRKEHDRIRSKPHRR